jgi:hypothetical protein
MEELSYEDNLNLQNNKEHLRVVLGNVRIASEELTQLYNEISSVNKLLVQARRDRDSILEVASKAAIETSEEKVAQDKRGAVLFEKENKQLEVDKLFQQKILEAIMNLKILLVI